MNNNHIPSKMTDEEWDAWLEWEDEVIDEMMKENRHQGGTLGMALAFIFIVFVIAIALIATRII